jgi:xanthine dehydrogenase YagR molybdenum-binding subunit
MVGSIGMALMERTVLDPRDGRLVNAHMADYLVPVNLDIPQLEAHLVDEEDPHVNPLGVKGLGEIALIGMAPAIVNAVFHGTGKRVRDLPIHIEDVLTAGAFQHRPKESVRPPKSNASIGNALFRNGMNIIRRSG